MDMSKLIPLMADAFSREDLIAKIAEGSAECLKNPTDENISHLEFDCTLLCTKRAIEVSGGIEVLSRDLKHHKDLHDTDKMLRSIPGVELTGDKPSPN